MDDPQAIPVNQENIEATLHLVNSMIEGNSLLADKVQSAATGAAAALQADTNQLKRKVQAKAAAAAKQQGKLVAALAQSTGTTPPTLAGDAGPAPSQGPANTKQAAADTWDLWLTPDGKCQCLPHGSQPPSTPGAVIAATGLTHDQCQAAAAQVCPQVTGQSGPATPPATTLTGGTCPCGIPGVAQFGQWVDLDVAAPQGQNAPPFCPPAGPLAARIALSQGTLPAGHGTQLLCAWAWDNRATQKCGLNAFTLFLEQQGNDAVFTLTAGVQPLFSSAIPLATIAAWQSGPQAVQLQLLQPVPTWKTSSDGVDWTGGTATITVFVCQPAGGPPPPPPPGVILPPPPPPILPPPPPPNGVPCPVPAPCPPACPPVTLTPTCCPEPADIVTLPGAFLYGNFADEYRSAYLTAAQVEPPDAGETIADWKGKFESAIATLLNRTPYNPPWSQSEFTPLQYP